MSTILRRLSSKFRKGRDSGTLERDDNDSTQSTPIPSVSKLKRGDSGKCNFSLEFHGLSPVTGHVDSKERPTRLRRAWSSVTRLATSLLSPSPRPRNSHKGRRYSNFFGYSSTESNQENYNEKSDGRTPVRKRRFSFPIKRIFSRSKADIRSSSGYESNISLPSSRPESCASTSVEDFAQQANKHDPRKKRRSLSNQLKRVFSKRHNWHNLQKVKSEQKPSITFSPVVDAKSEKTESSERLERTARGRRWKRRSRNRELDSILEGTINEFDDTQLGDPELVNTLCSEQKRSPQDEIKPMKTYTKASKNRYAEDSDYSTSTAMPASTATSNVSLTDDEYWKSANHSSTGGIKITYISCPFKTPNDKKKGSPKNAETLMNKGSKSTENSKPILPYYHIDTAQSKKGTKFFPDFDSPVLLSNMERKTTSRQKSDSAIGCHLNTLTKYPHPMISPPHGKFGVNSKAQKAPLPIFSKLHKTIDTSVDDCLLSQKPQNIKMDKTIKSDQLTGGINVHIRRIHSLNDLNQYKRYYNFLIAQKTDPTNDIMAVFVKQLKDFQNQLKAKSHVKTHCNSDQAHDLTPSVHTKGTMTDESYISEETSEFSEFSPSYSCIDESVRQMSPDSPGASLLVQKSSPCNLADLQTTLGGGDSSFVKNQKSAEACSPVPSFPKMVTSGAIQRLSTLVSPTPFYKSQTDARQRYFNPISTPEKTCMESSEWSRSCFGMSQSEVMDGSSQYFPNI